MKDQAKTIFRTVKRENPYVQIDKTVLNDSRLSWKAKGLIVFLLSKPDDWVININNLVKQSKDGRDAVYAAIKELKAFGYIQQVEKRDPQGRVSCYEYQVFENPQLSEPSNTEPPKENVPVQNPSINPLPENPDTDKPDTGNPDTENPSLLKNELILKKDLTKIPPSFPPTRTPFPKNGEGEASYKIFEPVAQKLFGQTSNEILRNLRQSIEEFTPDPGVIAECLKHLNATEIKTNPYGYFRCKYTVAIAIVAHQNQTQAQEKVWDEIVQKNLDSQIPDEVLQKTAEEARADIRNKLGISVFRTTA